MLARLAQTRAAHEHGSDPEFTIDQMIGRDRAFPHSTILAPSTACLVRGSLIHGTFTASTKRVTDNLPQSGRLRVADHHEANLVVVQDRRMNDLHVYQALNSFPQTLWRSEIPVNASFSRGHP